MHQACLNQLSSLAHPKFHTECGKGGESRPGSGKTQPHCPGEAGTGLCHCRTKVVVIPGGAQAKQGQAERSRAWSAEGHKAQRDPFVTMTQREQREKLEQNSSWKCTGAGKDMRDKAGTWSSIYILRGEKIFIRVVKHWKRAQRIHSLWCLHPSAFWGDKHLQGLRAGDQPGQKPKLQNGAVSHCQPKGSVPWPRGAPLPPVKC